MTDFTFNYWFNMYIKGKDCYDYDWEMVDYNVDGFTEFLNSKGYDVEFKMGSGGYTRHMTASKRIDYPIRRMEIRFREV